MLNPALSPLSLDQLKDVIFHNLTTLDVALVYVLMYVVYKALGRYIYFKPEEHASKINRTFLVLSLLAIVINILKGAMGILPINSEYRWLYVVSTVVILIAPLSILMDRVLWQRDRTGYKRKRNWLYYYFPIPHDYYKTTISKSEQSSSSSLAITHQWEEEGVESTPRNLHSDALLNLLALIIYLVVSGRWAWESSLSYGWLSIALFCCISLPMAAVFFDRSIFSWIDYLQLRRN